MRRKDSNGWAYSPVTGSLKMAAAATAATGFFVWGLSGIFNPIALGVAGAYALYKVGAGYAFTMVPDLRRKMVASAIKEGEFTPLAKDHSFQKMTNELSDRMGRPVPPDIYLVDEEFVLKMAAPWGLRWLLKGAVRQQMHKVFAAVPGANMMLTTRQALAAREYDDESMRFVIAHELSHMQSDDHLTFERVAKGIINNMTKVLALGCGAAMISGMLGIASAPAFLTLSSGGFVALCAAVGTWAVASLGTKYASRVMERRADRNALYVTRDLRGAGKLMDTLHDTPGGRSLPSSKLGEAFHAVSEAYASHPSYYPRTESLRDSWNKVAAHPAPKWAVAEDARKKADGTKKRDAKNYDGDGPRLMEVRLCPLLFQRFYSGAVAFVRILQLVDDKLDMNAQIVQFLTK